MIRAHPGSGSQIQRSRRHRIPDPGLQRCRLLVISCERDPLFYISRCCALAGTLSVGHGGGVRRYNGPDVDTIIAKSMRQAVAKFHVPKFVFLKFSRHHLPSSALLVRTWGIVVSHITFHVLLLLPRIEICHFSFTFAPSSAVSALLVRTWDIIVSDIIFHFLISYLPFSDPNVQLSRLFFLSQTAKSHLGGVRYAEKIVGKPFNMS
jgi:hypothetical protein